MGDEATKLVVLRGPSASGKSSVAVELLSATKRKVAFIQEDHVRRQLLQRHDNTRDVHKKVIHELACIALDNDFDVILEGILSQEIYRSFLQSLFDKHRGANYLFHLDVSFKETLKRHQSKSTKDEYGSTEMKQWFPAGAPLEFEIENKISETFTLAETVRYIQEITGL